MQEAFLEEFWFVNFLISERRRKDYGLILRRFAQPRADLRLLRCTRLWKHGESLRRAELASSKEGNTNFVAASKPLELLINHN